MHILSTSLLTLAIGLPHAVLDAQSELEEPLILSVGTHLESEATGATYTYLSWQETAEGALGDSPVAIYRKDGTADESLPYSREAIIRPFTDPAIIASLLDVGEKLNDDLWLLENSVEELFGEILEGAQTVTTLSEKLSALQQAAQTDANLRDTLQWLGRAHPALNLSLGRSYAQEISRQGPVTYEIRQWDPVAYESLEPIGRITIDPSDPSPFLPAPATPIIVDDGGPRGHLSARFIWSTPDRLRELAPLHYGYNLYRVDEDYAEANDWHTDPPDRADFFASSEVHQVNQAPVLPSQILSESEAQATADETGGDSFDFFVHDDNRRFHDGEPFEDGDTFYYFLAARDVVGRDGQLSAGKRVVMCHRMPPNPPARVSVDNDYRYDGDSASEAHHLKVTWDPESGGEADYYLVYRFDSINQMQSATVDDYETTNFQASGPIPADAVDERGNLTFIDDGSSGAPAAADAPGPDDYGRTFYYTVRAVRDSACAGLLSGHSPPTWGVLRQRTGPEGTEGTIRTYDYVIDLAPPTAIESGRQVDVADDRQVIQLTVERNNPGIEWAEFRLEPPEGQGERLPYGPQDFGRVYFPEGENEVSVIFTNPAQSVLPNSQPIFFAQAGGQGLVSEEESISFEWLEGYDSAGFNGLPAKLVFQAELNQGYDLPGAPPTFHASVDPVTGSINCPQIRIPRDTSDSIAEWRVYRRLNGGELELVHQEMRDPEEAGELDWDDCSLPARGGNLCYYVQTLDDEGNPGPINQLGCIDATPTQNLPKPMLHPLRSAGEANQPGAEITWFSSPEGVERFEVLIALEDGAPPSDLGGELSTRRNDSPLQLSEFPDEAFYAYDTGRVGTALRGDGPEFTVEAQLPAGPEYTVVVRAVGPGPREALPADGERAAIPARSHGQPSNSESYRWTTAEEEPGPSVPWPALYVSALDEDLENPLAVRAVSPQAGVGVRIGEFRFLFEFEEDEEKMVEMPTNYPYPLPDGLNPNDAVFTLDGGATMFDLSGETSDRTLLPAALYRYQLPNELYPQVGGDLVQVSPLVQEIAYESFEMADHRPLPGELEDAFSYFSQFQGKDYNVLQDPFMAARDREDFDALTDENTHELILLDTQPVVQGAKYRYLLVRFDESGEIDRVLPVDPIEITPDLFE